MEGRLERLDPTASARHVRRVMGILLVAVVAAAVWIALDSQPSLGRPMTRAELRAAVPYGILIGLLAMLAIYGALALGGLR